MVNCTQVCLNANRMETQRNAKKNVLKCFQNATECKINHNGMQTQTEWELYDHYCTYRQTIDKLRPRGGETWIICGKQYLILMMKWIADSTSISEVGELLATDVTIRLMPRLVANHVRDHTPTTLMQVMTLADDFMCTRRWSYDQLLVGGKTEQDRQQVNISS